MSLFKRIAVVAIAVFAFTFALASKQAKACGSGSSGPSDGALVALAVVGLGVVGADGTFGVYDLVKAGEGEHASKGMAIAETAVAAPQVGLIAWYWSSQGAQINATSVILSAIPTALFLHGVITLVSVDWSKDAAPNDASTTLIVPNGAPTTGNQVVPATTKTYAPTVAPPTPREPNDRMRIGFAPTMIPTGPSGRELSPAVMVSGVF